MPRRLLVLVFALTMTDCASSTAPEDARTVDPAMVLRKTWQWVSSETPSEELEVPNPERYTIRFGEDGKVQAQFDCNRGSGAYQIDRGKLSLGPLLSTRMACPPDSLDSQFVEDLQGVGSFFIRDGDLFLEFAAGEGKMRFQAAP